MNKLLIVIAMVFPPLLVAQATSSVTGKWKVTSSVAGNDSAMDCNFTRTDAAISDTCKAEQGDIKITGKVDGALVTWSYSSEYNGTPLTMTYKGKLTDGKIAAEVTVDPYGVSGEFTAVNQK